MPQTIQTSFEARRPWKVFASIVQWASLLVVIASIINVFAPFGFPKWAFYVGGGTYFIAMLGGMKVSWFRNR